MDKICVYCGSSRGRRTEYVEGARSFAEVLVSRNIALIYGGGSIGIMGVLADAVLARDGKAFGIIPKDLEEKEAAHENLTELQVVRSMHERKTRMAELSDGFVALPGGLGTLEEICEVLTWAQLGFHSKPCGLLNVAGYYDQLAAFFDHTVSEQFVDETHRSLIMVESDPTALLERFDTYQSPVADNEIESNAS